MATHRALRFAPWSASKIQTALRCPKLFHYRYVQKLPEPEVMPETRIGKAVHTSLEHALRGMPLAEAIDKGAGSLANSDEDDRFRRLCRNIVAYQERIEKFRQRNRVDRQFIEFRMGMDVNGDAIAFSAKKAFFRGIVDAAYCFDSSNFALIDHKSGLRQPNSNIAEQLEGYAVLAACSFRGLRKVLLGIHWLSSAEVDWSEPLSLDHIRQELQPKIMSNIEAAALAVDDGPRAQESSWCLRCSYRNVCPQADIARFQPAWPEEADE